MPEPLTGAYRAVLTASSPVVRTWGQLQVSGLEVLPAEGPVLLAGNHDSYWDPIAIGIAARPRRQIRALAKSSTASSVLAAEAAARELRRVVDSDGLAVGRRTGPERVAGAHPCERVEVDGRF